MELKLVSEPIIKATEKAQAKLTAKQIYEWGNTVCPHKNMYQKWECEECRQELQEASK